MELKRELRWLPFVVGPVLALIAIGFGMGAFRGVGLPLELLMFVALGGAGYIAGEKLTPALLDAVEHRLDVRWWSRRWSGRG
ncbi:hypothetical protein [Streptomyces sp. NBC_01304]|uniref:hypothetical protein n=1 Tax=Streptomyces sp. NBC_01304 TaxID=2903818 RepID=UPI002E1561CB|nr:hypothetical protein OG430_49260 [Streptomyces sp. NBC_01304]